LKRGSDSKKKIIWAGAVWAVLWSDLLSDQVIEGVSSPPHAGTLRYGNLARDFSVTGTYGTKERLASVLQAENVSLEILPFSVNVKPTFPPRPLVKLSKLAMIPREEISG
jgi:hypothetical protein